MCSDMCSHSSLGRVIGILVHLLLIFGGIVIGLTALKINLFEMNYMTNMPILTKSLQIAIGIAAILSLIYLVMPKHHHDGKDCMSSHKGHKH